MELLVIFEGDTENAVLLNFLRPYIPEPYRRSVIPFNMKGNTTLKRDYAKASHDHLRAAKSNIVLCLVDLFEQPFKVNVSPDNLEEHVHAVQQVMRASIDANLWPRFGAFPVVHELETWLLADIHVLKQIDSTSEPITSPEQIKHPASYLTQLWEAKHGNNTYSKVNTGIHLFGIANAKRVYEDNCPHFNLMIDWLEQHPLAEINPKDEIIVRKVVELQDTLARKIAAYQKRFATAQTEEDLIELENLEAEIDEINLRFNDPNLYKS
jgi:hypothetical protein